MNALSQSAIALRPASVILTHTVSIFRPPSFHHGFGMHLHKPRGDKLEDLGGELLNEVYIRAAMWRVRH